MQNTPWYRKKQEYIDFCDSVDSEIEKIMLTENSIYSSEIVSFDGYQKISTVYESNLIEEAGMPKEATRKIITENYPNIPTEIAFFKGDVQSKIFAFVEANVQLNENIKDKAKPSITFKNKNRDQLEVLRHYDALNQAWTMGTATSVKFLFDQLEPKIRTDILDKIDNKKDLLRLKSKVGEFITENMIKKLHLTLAKGLMPENAGVDAGIYRIDERGVGDQSIKFPSPDLINECMKVWVAQTNSTLAKMHSGEINPYRAAAEISYKFVWIHPFPDFNGRMSRLIMNYVLRAAGKFIHVDLRGGSKNKHQYITALKRANRGDYNALEALIAKRRSEILANLRANLVAAGYSFEY